MCQLASCCAGDYSPTLTPCPTGSRPLPCPTRWPQTTKPNFSFYAYNLPPLRGMPLLRYWSRSPTLSNRYSSVQSVGNYGDMLQVLLHCVFCSIFSRSVALTKMAHKLLNETWFFKIFFSILYVFEVVVECSPVFKKGEKLQFLIFVKKIKHFPIC